MKMEIIIIHPLGNKLLNKNTIPMYSVILNLQTLDTFVISKNALDYTEYLMMPSHYKERFSGTKRECEEYVSLEQEEKEYA